MAFENFPYTNFHEINLDWIVAKVKEAYSASNPPDYPVKSVNGMTGDVIIAIPANLVSSVNGETGDVVLYRNPLTQFPATDEQRWNLFRICDGDERGIEFDEDGAHRIEGTRRILIYDEENQPDYPVTSVNGQTGDVRITAGVNSVNGKTGNVVTPFVNPNTDILKLDSNSNTVLWGISRDVSGGNVALYITSGSGSPQAFIRYTPTDGQAINLPLLTNADIPESAGVVSVNRKTGAVTLTGEDINITSNSNVSLYQSLINISDDIKLVYSSIYELGNASIIGWESGNYLPTTGAENSNNAYIRTTNTIPNNIDAIKSQNNIVFALQAWENGEYKGLLNKETEDFYFTNVFYNNIYNFLNIASLRHKYPTYVFKLSARNNPQAENMPITEAENIQTYISITGGDSGDIRQIVSNHTQQISELQSADSTHDQQISELQSADATHNQQISALQAEDSTHAQQIAELQSTDATHSQQITDLYNASVTQGNQINDLYTRTGIYEIFIENVSSLPLRYPATGTDAKIKSTNIVVDMVVYISGVQVSDWQINTYDGYLEISGTINGLSSITLYLA